VEKMRELSVSGDAISNRFFSDFEAAVDRGDVVKLLSIEREILNIARDELEFIGEIEYVDLKRIHEDRNRCAHPTVNISGSIFHPSPDLARSHIVHAIEHLLIFPPSHGKNALKRLLDDVKSPYFPSNVPKALEVLEHSALVRARKSVARNFLVVLLKAVVKDGDYKFVGRAISAIKAFSKINHEVYLDVMHSEISKIVRGLNDVELSGAIKIISIDTNTWDCLDPDQKRRLEEFFENLEGSNLDYIDSTYKIDELESAATRCVSKLSVESIRENFWLTFTRILIEMLINLCKVSYSYDHANLISKAFQENITDLTEDDAIAILRVGSPNGLVTGSFEYPRLIKALSARFPNISELH
jgi:hypothetical protein